MFNDQKNQMCATSQLYFGKKSLLVPTFSGDFHFSP